MTARQARSWRSSTSTRAKRRRSIMPWATGRKRPERGSASMRWTAKARKMTTWSDSSTRWLNPTVWQSRTRNGYTENSNCRSRLWSTPAARAFTQSLRWMPETATNMTSASRSSTESWRITASILTVRTRTQADCPGCLARPGTASASSCGQLTSASIPGRNGRDISTDRLSRRSSHCPITSMIRRNCRLS